MPVRYDSVACAAELLPKKFVLDNLAAGWRPSARGALPRPPIFPWKGVGVACAEAAPQVFAATNMDDSGPLVLVTRAAETNAAVVQAQFLAFSGISCSRAIWRMCTTRCAISCTSRPTLWSHCAAWCR